MARIYDTFIAGGPVMWPLLGLSIATFACALERAWFWYQLMSQEEQVVQHVLEALQKNWERATHIAADTQNLAIGRFLLAPLQLRKPTPETFHLAMEAAADKEFIQMRKGDKLLESVVAIAPLLGLLGTVTGLIKTFSGLKIGGGGSSGDITKAAAGIGEALTATATGMLVAILALAFFRIFASLQAQQMDYFSRVGSDLELLYRQTWYETDHPPINEETHTQRAISPGRE